MLPVIGGQEESSLREQYKVLLRVTGTVLGVLLLGREPMRGYSQMPKSHN